MRSKGSHGVFAPTPFPSPAAGEGPSGQIAACSTRRLGSVTSCYRFAVTPHKMRRRHLESVSAALYGRCLGIVRIQPQLSVRGSWGTAPSVFWFLLYAQKERPGGEPYRPSPFGDSATPIGDYKLSPAGQACSQSLAQGHTPRQAITNPPQNIIINPSFSSPIKPTIYAILAQQSPVL